MEYMVPYDGSDLATAALTKAKLYAVAIDEAPPELVGPLLGDDRIELVAVTVVPDSARAAREYGWIGPGEAFEVDRIVDRLREEVAEVAPHAAFEYERVDGGATSGTVGTRLRNVAVRRGVGDVFVGSEDAGRIVTNLSSVGQRVSADDRYDVHIVRESLPNEVRERVASEFTLPA